MTASEMYNAENIEAIAIKTSMNKRGKNPPLEAATGKARMPAPIMVELKTKMPLVVEMFSDMIVGVGIRYSLTGIGDSGCIDSATRGPCLPQSSDPSEQSER